MSFQAPSGCRRRISIARDRTSTALTTWPRRCVAEALTLIGGGVFANPIRTIWDAILWAFDQVGPFLHAELSVVVNGRNLGAELPPAELRTAARARGGDVIVFDRGGAAFVDS
jgi:hypothetical protein